MIHCFADAPVCHIYTRLDWKWATALHHGSLLRFGIVIDVLYGPTTGHLARQALAR
jgi:hypothetical protein